VLCHPVKKKSERTPADPRLDMVIKRPNAEGVDTSTRRSIAVNFVVTESYHQLSAGEAANN